MLIIVAITIAKYTQATNIFFNSQKILVENYEKFSLKTLKRTSKNCDITSSLIIIFNMPKLNYISWQYQLKSQ